MLTPNHGIINTYTANHQRVAYKQQDGIAKPSPSLAHPSGKLLCNDQLIQPIQSNPKSHVHHGNIDQRTNITNDGRNEEHIESKSWQYQHIRNHHCVANSK